MKRKKRILVAPLNWGLGHSTRCIPIIYALLIENFEVIITAEGRGLHLLKKEFPNIKFIDLKGFNIKYYNLIPMSFSMILQIPKILFSTYQENINLNHLVKEYKLDGIISDNRFGLFHKNIPSVFITHQLRIKSPFFENLIQKINYMFINKFSECWIIDNKKNGLASDLSSPKEMPHNYKYIGVHSRFDISSKSKKYDFLAILSGPEPQRTELEKIIIQEFCARDERSMIIQGKTEEESEYAIGNCQIISSASSKSINKYILDSKIIFCRSGYSTIMDLSKLQAKAILIPTPGQTEQEYLAKSLKEKKICFSESQKKFDLATAVKEHCHYSGFTSCKQQVDWKKLFCLF